MLEKTTEITRLFGSLSFGSGLKKRNLKPG